MNRAAKLNKPSPVNCRRWPRYKVNWQFQMEGVDRNGRVFWVDGTLRDISARSSSGYCCDPPEAGTRVVISMKMPFKAENWIRYLAEIVRREETPAGTFVALYFVSNRPVFYSQDAKNKSLIHSSDGNTAQFDSKVIFTA